jgi:hypothetical protein
LSSRNTAALVLAFNGLTGMTLVVLAAAALVVIAATGVIDHVPIYDELLHYLAAQSGPGGRPAIAHGEYPRALLFTKLVAIATSHFGNSLVAARIPAMTASAMLVALLAAWTASRAGLLAGGVTALALCMVPDTVELAVLARFYTVHALLVLLIAVAAYEALSPDHSLVVRASLGLSAFLLLPLAWHFQSTTLVAAGAVSSGAAAVLLLDHWESIRRRCVRHPGACTAAVAATLAAGLLLLWKIDVLGRMAEVPVWAAWSADRPQFYVLDLAQRMPLLWAMFPVAILIALATERRLAVFCIVALTVALIAHSIAAAKATRYVYYIMPLLCVIWGCAVSRVLAQARRSAAGPFRATVLFAAAVLVVGCSQEGQRLAKLVLQRADPAEVLSYGTEADWREALPVLQPSLKLANRVVTSNSMKAIHYLGHYDYELNVSTVAETDTHADFGIDSRTGERAIGSAQAVASVVSAPGVTLVILEDEKAGVATGVPHAALQAIRSHCVPIAVPESSRILVWQCGRQRN